MVGPDHRGDAGFTVYRDRGSVVFRRNDHDGQSVLPGARERKDFVRGAPSRMNEDRIGSRVGVGVSAQKCLDRKSVV